MRDSLQDIYTKKLNELTKEDVKKFMEVPCRGRGEHILEVEREAFIFGGAEGVKKLKEEMKKLGYPINFSKINSLDWYPVGLRTLGFIVLKKLFNLKDNDFKEMGIRAANFSFVVKFFFKHFLSRETAFEHVSNYWRKHHTCGRLEPVEFYEEKKGGREGRLIMRLHDFKLHPIYCKFFLGYFLQVAKLLGGKEAAIEETKCIFTGTPYHEFMIKWN